jgi:hypothetical protein
MKATMKLAAHLGDALQQYDSLHVDEFAEAIAWILRTEYGKHNYQSFINTLTQNLYPHGK